MVFKSRKAEYGKAGGRPAKQHKESTTSEARSSSAAIDNRLSHVAAAAAEPIDAGAGAHHSGSSR